MKIKVHGDIFGRVTVLDKELPTLKTPIGELDSFWRMVFAKLDTSYKRWHGCWMWTGATTDKGEPRGVVRDNFTRKDARLGVPQKTILKHEIAFKYLDLRKVPRRRDKGVAIDKPDIDVVHLCGNVGCLNPAHFVCCMDDAKHRDLKQMRDDSRSPYFLPPGTYYEG